MSSKCPTLNVPARQSQFNWAKSVDKFQTFANITNIQTRLISRREFRNGAN